ncbi:type 1 glutamine amidotransferase [Agrobacterium tumefaciens]|uniref:type 1 glutamine amidotransferase n=1 Tax=Agrobacterium tumefaciens TaxID=358 RepID=UPI0012B96F3B|nr:type 1 glutamine amidotransferase [Agrobacterium tumefaciens]MQB07307.1 type 1 glutamine amidotransferase [Agrobacterium tumefaciens]
MKRALILQHIDHDHPGRFLDYFAADGIVPEFIRVWEGQKIPALSGFDLMFSAGGPQDVWQTAENPWIATEIEAIREWVGVRAKPFIGICLGYQLMAEAMGGKVALAATNEMGPCQITLTREGRAHPFMRRLPEKQTVMQFHFAEVKEVPPGGQVLSSSPLCAVQALAIGNHAFGSQFHCEHTPQTYGGWASQPLMRNYLDKHRGPDGLATLMAETFPHMQDIDAETRTFYENFAHASGLKRG